MCKIFAHVEDYEGYKFYDLYFFIYKSVEALRMVKH